MQTIISLEDIKIYSFHGVMPEERLTGAYFNINISIYVDVKKSLKTDNLEHTLNYSDINDIIHFEMKTPSLLLENVAYRILKSIFSKYKEIKNIDFKISKLNPPIIGDVKSSSFKIITSREEFSEFDFKD